MDDENIILGPGGGEPCPYCGAHPSVTFCSCESDKEYNKDELHPIPEVIDQSNFQDEEDEWEKINGPGVCRLCGGTTVGSPAPQQNTFVGYCANDESSPRPPNVQWKCTRCGLLYGVRTLPEADDTHGKCYGCGTIVDKDVDNFVSGDGILYCFDCVPQIRNESHNINIKESRKICEALKSKRWFILKEILPAQPETKECFGYPEHTVYNVIGSQLEGDYGDDGPRLIFKADVDATKDDAVFAAHARTALPAALDRIEVLEMQVAWALNMLENAIPIGGYTGSKEKYLMYIRDVLGEEA